MSSKQSGNKRGQGDAYKSTNEVAFLSEAIDYSSFVHSFKLKGKFIVPSLMPLMQTTNTYNKKEKANVSTRSGNKYNTTVDKTNYIEAFIPLNIVWKFVIRTKIKQFSENAEDTNLYINVHIPKDTEFILSFINDDINKCRVISVNERY